MSKIHSRLLYCRVPQYPLRPLLLLSRLCLLWCLILRSKHFRECEALENPNGLPLRPDNE